MASLTGPLRRSSLDGDAEIEEAVGPPTGKSGHAEEKAGEPGSARRRIFDRRWPGVRGIVYGPFLEASPSAKGPLGEPGTHDSSALRPVSVSA